MDTIKFRLDKQYAPNTDFFNETASYLSDISYSKNKYGKYIAGYIDGLKVKISENDIKVGYGSLTKFIFSNNLKNRNRTYTKHGIELLSDKLHLPMQISDVLRYDYAINIEVNHKPKIYYDCLGDLKNHLRFLTNSTLYFSHNNGSKKLLFYDKIREFKSKDKLPSNYENINLLRIEAQYLKGLCKEFNYATVKANMLYDEIFSKKVSTNFQEYYSSIYKINNPIINFNLVRNKTEFQNQCVLYMINSIGTNELLSQLDRSFLMKQITSKEKFDLRKAIKNISNNSKFTTYTDEINELDTKIAEKVQELLL
jgi:hypothetical protein